MNPVRINVGCGRNVLPGWVNLDSFPLPGIDVVYDLETASTSRLPLEDNSVHEFQLSHVVEHIRNVLPMMQELHRVAVPGAIMTIRCPHGASDDADEDPTHVRRMFPLSFGYFSQPYYWRADYGYRGDWDPTRLELRMARLNPDELRAGYAHAASHRRNSVLEMIATLVAIKPVREPRREYQKPMPIIYVPHAG